MQEWQGWGKKKQILYLKKRNLPESGLLIFWLLFHPPQLCGLFLEKKDKCTSFGQCYIVLGLESGFSSTIEGNIVVLCVIKPFVDKDHATNQSKLYKMQRNVSVQRKVFHYTIEKTSVANTFSFRRLTSSCVPQEMD